MNIQEKIKLEYYYGENKAEGVALVEKHNMLQYHYFVQDIRAVKQSSLIVLITLTHKGIKEYIGFMSLGQVLLDNRMRNRFFGKRFYRNLRKIMNDKMKILRISRIVFLPSFRGLGLSKMIQDTVIEDLFSNSLPNFDKVLYVELSSIMLHDIDFTSKYFNKTFLNAKEVLSEKEYKKLYKVANNSKAKGYKEGTSKLAQTVFAFNMKYFSLLKKYYKEYYNVTLTEADKETLLNDVESYSINEDEPIILNNVVRASNNNDYVPATKAVA